MNVSKNTKKVLERPPAAGRYIYSPRTSGMSQDADLHLNKIPAVPQQPLIMREWKAINNNKSTKHEWLALFGTFWHRFKVCGSDLWWRCTSWSVTTL